MKIGGVLLVFLFFCNFLTSQTGIGITGGLNMSGNNSEVMVGPFYKNQFSSRVGFEVEGLFSGANFQPNLLAKLNAYKSLTIQAGANTTITHRLLSDESLVVRNGTTGFFIGVGCDFDSNFRFGYRYNLIGFAQLYIGYGFFKD